MVESESLNEKNDDESINPRGHDALNTALNHSFASLPAEIQHRSSLTPKSLSSHSRRTRRRMRLAADASSPRDYPPAPRRASTLPAQPSNGRPDNPHLLGSQMTTRKNSSFVNLNNALSGLLQPQVKLAAAPSWKASAINTIRYSYLNFLLVFIPVSWAVHFAGLPSTVVFVFSFISIIPLAALLGFATEELSLHVGQTLSGLLNATFGNAVELIIAILALVKGELRVVQSSMLGSILSNCLLVLGMCFFAGGFRFHEQGYGIRAQQLNISLLSISVFSIVIPAAFHSSLNIASSSGQTPGEESGETGAIQEAHVLAISRGTSIILLVVYAAYLLFQLWTHAYLYTAEASAHHAAHAQEQGLGSDGPSAPIGAPVFRMPNFSLPSLPSLPSVIRRHSHSSSSSTESTSNAVDTMPQARTDSEMWTEVSVHPEVAADDSDKPGVGMRSVSGVSATTSVVFRSAADSGQVSPSALEAGLHQPRSIARVVSEKEAQGDSGTAVAVTSVMAKSPSTSVLLADQKHEPKLKLHATLVLLIGVTVMTGITAEWLVDSIDGLTKSGAISREFVALILLPLVGNAAEHVTAVTVSVKNKLDLAMTVAVGSSIQIALFVIPFLVILGWIIGQPLSLFFDIFETIVVFVSVLIVNYAISDGRTNWLEGFVLMIVYVIIGLSVWYYPGSQANAPV